MSATSKVPPVLQSLYVSLDSGPTDTQPDGLSGTMGKQ